MFDCDDLAARFGGEDGDPRLDERYVRCVERREGLGTVALLGVVHDHPASVYRVAALVDALDPDVLALELPPLAVPLFRFYADDSGRPPRLGGEMSAALQAAPGARPAGIDAPSRPYFRPLVAELRVEPVTAAELRAVLRDVLDGAAQAVACRVAAVVSGATPFRIRVYAPIPHDVSLLDPPAAQAADETAYLAQRRTFLRAIEVPRPTRVVDAAREAVMVGRLRDLRREGDVAAVVGMEHLDAVAAGLAAASPTRT